MRNGSSGSSRRDFVRVGTIGLGAVTLGIGCGGGSAESPRTGPPTTDSGDNRDLGMVLAEIGFKK